MTGAQEVTRRRLIDAGLGDYVDLLLAHGRPSVRLAHGQTAVAPKRRFRLPAPVPGLERGVNAVSGNDSCRYALRDDGTVLAWGYNADGQLGDGTRVDRSNPVQVIGVEGAVALGARGAPLAIVAGGSLLGWGSNARGPLGGDAGGDRLVAGPVAWFDKDVVWATVWAGHTTRVIKADGTAWELGEYTSGRPVEVHLPAPGLRYGGWDGVLGACADGTVLVWHMTEAPLRHPTLRNVVAVCHQLITGLAVRSDGSVVTWGAEVPGGPLTAPPEVVVESDAVAIAAGIGSVFALKRDGSVWAWGSNHAGSLGTGADDYLALPVRVPELEDVVSIDCGVALKSDGAVWTWGGELPLGDDPAGDAGLRLGGSRLGGRPDLPTGAAWPTQDGRPLVFVGQVDLGDVAPADVTGLLPTSGLLTFFYALVHDPASAVVASVVFSAEGTALARLDFPHALPVQDRMRAIPLMPEPDITVHPEEVLPEPASWNAQVTWECYGFEDGVPPRHRMLGYPDLIQPQPQIGRHLLLLQVDMYHLPGGSGILYFVIPPEDLRARRFDRVMCEYECD